MAGLICGIQSGLGSTHLVSSHFILLPSSGSHLKHMADLVSQALQRETQYRAKVWWPHFEAHECV